LTMKPRPFVFAQQGWYPRDPSQCKKEIENYFSRCQQKFQATTAGIVPHAGWAYSGQVAAQTFSALKAADPQVVFLFGGHMHPSDHCLCMPEGAFDTPLGHIEVESDLASALVETFHCDRETTSNFHPENTVELQLPFIRSVWPMAKIVAVLVPPSPIADEIGLWTAQQIQGRKQNAVAIGSTDLTHYGVNYGFTPHGLGNEALRWSKEENDRPFLHALLQFNTQDAIRHALEHHSACCPGAAAAAVAFAKESGKNQGELLVHTTSHEVEPRGKPAMWVGYASMVF
jgi:MEMO1 family protein